MLTRLVRYGWLRRTVEFPLSDQLHIVEYSGRGVFGWVKVDGVRIRKFCWYWFVPRFEFRVGEWGEYPGVVEVRVWPWCFLRSFVMRIDGEIVYEEKSRPRFSLRAMMIAVALAGLGLGLMIPVMDQLFNPFRSRFKKAAEYYARRARMATDTQEKVDLQAKADRYAESSQRIVGPPIMWHDEILRRSFDDHD